LQAKRDIDQKATSGRDVESMATQRGCAHSFGNMQVYKSHPIHRPTAN